MPPVAAPVDELLRSLLYEGYALYPYTPGATKNATPTPFGIVYPPAYAARSGATFDHLQVECLLDGGGRGDVEASVLFLQATGEGHRATERQIGVDGPGEQVFEHEGVRGRIILSVVAGDPARVRLRVENLTEVPAELTRADALARSLLSTHAVLRTPRGRFRSPLESEGCINLNTWPVLATAADDTILAAAIFLPDHPQLASESRGDLFDGTEIEEALLLHVHALSDAERREIDGGDAVVRGMVERAVASSAEDIMRLHGQLRPVPAELGRDPRLGEQEAVVDGVVFRPGDRLLLCLAARSDPYDRMLDGRIATLERIYERYDGRVQLAVTVDSDPMQDVMRDTGRYLFFFPEEVEVVPPDEGGTAMSEGAKREDNPPPAPDAGEKGLGSETDAEPDGPDDVTRLAPERRGEVRYPDVEDPDEVRPSSTPQEGRVEKDADTAQDSSND